MHQTGRELINQSCLTPLILDRKTFWCSLRYGESIREEKRGKCMIARPVPNCSDVEIALVPSPYNIPVIVENEIVNP